jgi:Type II secretion system (T2SS), protein M subtype b
MSKRNRTLIQWVLGAVLLIDLVLVGIIWRMSTTPRTGPADIVLLKRQHDLLAADVARGARIRETLPAVEKQCDTFLMEQLPAVTSGYSSVVDNLGEVARTAGLRTENVAYRQHDPDKHGIIVVEIGATVNGDYPSVVRFINGLERSNNFYVLDGLQLAESSAGNVKLNLRLRTYFRS